MAAVSSQELQDAWEKVKAMTILPEPPEPKLPTFGPKMPMKSKLHAIQTVITALEYNYTGTLYFDVNKNRSFKSIANTAKDILRDGLPIQCLEAVFLGAYLTAGLPNLDRFPISFKTSAGTSTHRHIVLGIRHQQQKWGALGLSRCDKLMNKEVKFDSLSELVLDYCNEFQNVYHKVEKVNVGFPLTHDIHSSERVEWRVLNLSLDTNSWADVAKQLDTFAKDAAELDSFKKTKGELPAWFHTKYALNAPEIELTRSPRRNRSSFSDEYYDDDEEPPEPALVEEARTPPIIVTPGEIVFKKQSSLLQASISAPPTNIFLQNTTMSPYLVEIEDTSGLLEIVTKAQPMVPREKTQQTETNLDNDKPVSTFRISAKGMIVVAIKYNLHQPDKIKSTELSKPAKTGDNAHESFTESDDSNEPHQTVTFRCTPTARDSLDDELPDAETYTHDAPFVLKDM